MKPRSKKVSIKVDAAMYAAAKAMLATRGTDLDTWVNLQLRSFAKSSKSMLGLKDRMTLGKYQGALIEDIVRADPRYLNWLIGENARIKFDQPVHELLASLDPSENSAEFNQDYANG